MFSWVPSSLPESHESSEEVFCTINHYSFNSIFFLPEVIVWDPISQFPALLVNSQLRLCIEPKCNQEMKFVAWQDGSSQRYNPRCVNGVRGCVVLVCKINGCKYGHSITSCDPHLLKYFQPREKIPFILLHKSGITRELQLLIFQLCCLGKSFTDIQTLLLWTIQDNCPHKVMCMHSVHRRANLPKILIYTSVKISLLIPLSSHLMSWRPTCIRRCRKWMQNWSAVHDHTFKMTSHVGVFRNGKWVPQYDSLFKWKWPCSVLTVNKGYSIWIRMRWYTVIEMQKYWVFSENNHDW